MSVYSGMPVMQIIIINPPYVAVGIKFWFIGRYDDCIADLHLVAFKRILLIVVRLSLWCKSSWFIVGS